MVGYLFSFGMEVGTWSPTRNPVEAASFDEAAKLAKGFAADTDMPFGVPKAIILTSSDFEAAIFDYETLKRLMDSSRFRG